MVSVGVDIHKASGFMMVKDDAGRVLASFTFKNNRLGISEFVDRLQAFRDVKVLLSLVGTSGLSFMTLLKRGGLGLFYPIPRRLGPSPRLRLGRITWMLQRLLTFWGWFGC
jgi:hypothetical protein